MAQHNYNQEKPDPAEGIEMICAQTVYDGRLIDPDWWFDQTARGQRNAVDLCQQCPFILKCAEYGVKNQEEFGVWGGLTPEDRRRLRRNKSRRISFKDAKLSEKEG